VQELIDAYLDGELDLTGTLEIERHLADCQLCAETLSGLQHVQAAVRASLVLPTPTRLQRRVRKALWREVAPRRRLVLGGIAVALTAAVGLTASGWWLRQGSEDLARAVAAAHVQALVGGHCAGGVLSSDRQTVAQWFVGRLDYEPIVPDVASADVSLLGGRIDYLNGRAVAALVYQRRKHIINLFLWPAPGDAASDPKLMSREGYSLFNWRRAGMTWWVVSDLNAADLRAFVTEVQNRT
jgi:anti-sigma factor RsiW